MSPLAGLRNILASHTQMSSANTQQGFPAIPPSLNPNDHELREPYIVDQDSDDVAPNTAPYYTPYLGLRARLSQIWINKWTILLLLILCRVLLAIRGLDHDIDSARAKALSSCTSVENVGSAMASMPHYMSQGVNKMAAAGVTKAVGALMDMLMLTITGIEEIVLFVINMMTSTYACLITLVVGGSLHVALDMIQKVGDFMNQTIGTITDGISNDVNSFQNEFNSFLSTISSVSGLFGGSGNPPKIDLGSSITDLKSIHLDQSQFDSDIQKLQDNIPDFEQVHNFTDNLIKFPFEEIKKLINASVGNYSFDHTVFPVAQKQALTFCSDNNGINEFFDGLSTTAEIARKVFIGVMIAAAIAVCIPMAYREIWKWRSMKQRALLLQRNAFDPMDVIYLAQRPYTSTAGIKAAARFKSTKRQILTRWFVAYATSTPALFVLLLALAGFFSCLCQYILLKSIEKEVPALAAQVGNFTGTVVNALNNASEAWAVSANGVIASTNDQVNQDVFGWVNTSTTAVNNTLNEFVDLVQKTLNDTFGGTILYTPIEETLKCLLFLKIEGIEKGLTWVHDNAHINFPEFDKDVFSLGAAASVTNSTKDDSFLSSPGSEAGDDITGAVEQLIAVMADTIQEETFIATALLCIYVFIVLIGLMRALIGMLGRDKTRGEGGPVYAGTGGFTGERRVSISPRTNNNAKFPTFGDGEWAAGGLEEGGSEKVGTAGQRSIGTIKKGHERTSSHGYVGGKF